MTNEIKDKLAELEKELYAKDFKPRATDGVVAHREAPVAPAWDKAGDVQELLNEQSEQASRHQKMKKFVQISIGFFVVALLVTVFVWWRGTNLISGENIGIDISAPTEVAGGEPFETAFTVTNKNQVSIESATLLVEYPQGFYTVANKTALPRISKDLGVIAPGQSVSEQVNTLLYGEQNTSKEVSVTLEYRLTGSKAILKKDTTYAVKILSSPVNVQLSLLKEISSGQGVDFTIDVTSNSKDPMGSLLVQAAFPAGFTFENANPAPAYNSNTWLIASLAPQEKRTIRVHGSIEGSETEQKITKISVGTQSRADEGLIDTVYNATSESLTITKPFVGLDLAVDNDRAPEHAVPFGRAVRADIYWENNNSTKITDAIVEVKVKGEALNRYQIYASGGGFYRSVDDTIVWDKSGTAALESIEPGARGSVSFGFSPIALGIDAGRVMRNPQITLEARVRARRPSDVAGVADITTFVSRKVNFETEVRLSARGLYYSGPFTNTGSLPPKIEKETTYTVALSVRNSSNDVSSATVKTTLPIYVKWLGRISPPGESVIYDQNTNEIIWNAGRIPAGGTREVAYQISFLPSLSQLKLAPLLTGPFSLTATDDFTKSSVRDSKQPITTNISSDPSFAQSQALVVN